MGAEKLCNIGNEEKELSKGRDDPYRFGTELPHWKLADDQLADHSELLICGGNRSAKTNFVRSE